MSIVERIDALKEKHQSIESAIEQEENRPHPDEVELHEMKKKKLRIKDEIVSLTAH
mgnify:CR=1 FL=1